MYFNSKTLAALIFAAATLAATCAANAAPLLAAGDLRVRHDLQLLADAGIIRGPTTTWPVSWPDIARDVAGVDPDLQSASVRAALLRLQRDAQRAARRGAAPASVSLSVAENPTRLRTFQSGPREEGELGIETSWLGDRFAFNLDAAMVANPQDERDARFDGSYLGASIANTTVAVGYIERWWGPGWDGSLILSTNARPIPAVAVERNYSDPFRLPVLRWLGPWRASVSMGQLEGHGVAVRDVRFFAARVAFRPTRWFEFALSRTAQWCGEGRPCGFDTFGDLLLGRDNPGDGLTAAEEPGNQLAGYDVRVTLPGVPVALYAQLIGEDEAGALPSRFLGLGGAELWGATRFGSHRLHFEYADTACNFSRAEPDFDCAYRHLDFPDGYVHRGRAIGHALDGDGRMYSAGATLVQATGAAWQLLVRRSELDRAGVVPDPAHTVSAGPSRIDRIELQYNHRLARGELRLGAGYDRSRERCGFIEWRHEL